MKLGKVESKVIFTVEDTINVDYGRFKKAVDFMWKDMKGLMRYRTADKIDLPEWGTYEIGWLQLQRMMRKIVRLLFRHKAKDPEKRAFLWEKVKDLAIIRKDLRSKGKASGKTIKKIAVNKFWAGLCYELRENKFIEV